MATDARALEVPPVVLSKLRRVRARKTRVRLAAAVFGSIALLFSAMVVAMCIDWYLMPESVTARSLLTMAALAAAGVAFACWTFQAIATGRKLSEVASDVDRSLPRLEERWSTITEVNALPHERQRGVHPAMLRRVAREAAHWEPHVEPKYVVSSRWLYRGIAGLGVAVVVLLAMLIADWRQTGVLVQRFWSPQRYVPFTQIELKATEPLAAKGEPYEIAAVLRGRPVEEATLLIKKEGKPTEEQILIPGGDSQDEISYRIRSVDESFEFRLRAGDGRTEWKHVAAAERPELAGARFTVTPPAYTKRQSQELKELPPTATIVEGSKLQLAFLPKNSVERFQLLLGESEAVELKPEEDGWYRWSAVVNRDFDLSPLMTGAHGLENRHPPYCHVHVYRDQAPVVRVTTPDNEMAVQPDDQIDIHFSAEDDFAIGKAELVVYEEPTELGGEPIEVSVKEIPLGDGQNLKKVNGTISLDLSEFGVEDGHELSYSIRVYDTRQVPLGQGEQLADFSPASAASTGEPADTSLAASTAAHAPQNEAASMAAAEPGPAPEASQTADSAASSSATEQPAESQSEVTPIAALPEDENGPAEPSDVPVSAGDATARLAAREPVGSDADASQDEAQNEPTATPQPGLPASQDSLAETSSPDSPNEVPAPDAMAANGAETSNAAQPDAEGNASPGAIRQMAENLARRLTPNTGLRSESATSPPQAMSQPGAQANAANRSDTDPAAPSDPDASSIASAEGESSTQESAASDQSTPTADAPASAATDRRPLMAKNDDSTSSSEQSESSNGTSTSSTAASAQAASQANQAESQTSSDGKVMVPEGGRMVDFNPNVPQEAAEPGEESGETGAPRPGNNMTRRMMDIAQVGTSDRQRLKVDQWAGSFEGQQREKLALAIAPVLEALDGHLERAENRTHELVKYMQTGAEWRSEQDRGVGMSDAALEEAQRIISQLDRQATDTPYAFISLQLTDIDQMNVSPARDSLWTTLQSDDGRQDHVNSAWQNIGRARERLAGLVQQFQRVRREHRLADRMQTVKKMYQVYLEDAYALLGNEASAINTYERQMAEFELDEEYLARLREVLEMRRELMSELSRILSDDPRLLRRFMDRFVDRQDTLRDQLTLHAERQERLERELRAWMRVEDARRPALVTAITRLRLAEAAEISELAARLSERFIAWLPLDLEVRDGELLRARDLVNKIAASARELQSSAGSYTPSDDASKTEKQVGEIAAAGRKVYDELQQFEASLRGVSMESEHPQIATHLVNRAADARELVERVSGWIRKVELLSSGQYHEVAAIDQHQLAAETQELAGKLADLEVQLAATLTGGSTQLPETIAEKVRQLMALFDNQIAPNQLGATYSLRQNRLPAAAVRESNAVKAFAEAEKLFDEVIQETIKELDKLPVQDPIASLLDDPTLDELLAELENEQLLAEELGIPNRPSNLSIMGDWLRPQRGSGQSAQMRLLINARLREQEQRTQQQMQQAYEKALARALKEMERVAKDAQKEKGPDAPAKQVDWNVLVSELRDDLMQGRGKLPPEEFRRAIEQYFDLISRAKAGSRERGIE